MTASKQKGFKKVLKTLDMTLFTVCAIIVIDTLAASASIGASTISWWILTLVLFFIPYGLVTAELGTTYTEQGGLYVWIKRAFGEKWAARSTWYYWINVALWMPSVYILFAGMFAQMFFPEMSLWTQIIIGIVMTWITVWIGTITLEAGKWVPNIGAFIKAAIMLVLGVGGIVYAMRNGVANDLSLTAMLPSWDAGLAFLPVIVYNFMGFELMSGAAEEMENPGKDILSAILTAGALIAFFYILATVGILLALPLDQLGLVSGIIDTLKAILGDSAIGSIAVTILGIGALYTFLANMVTWSMGANRTAAEASNEGELPAVFGKLHPVNKTPVGAYLITGIVSTLVLVIYGFMAGSNEELFWSLFAFSSIIFLLPYLALFPAFLKLRREDAAIKRPFQVPGGLGLATVIAVVCEIFILQAILFFIWVPGQPVDWAYATPVLTGIVVTIILGEVLLWGSKR
ncbi:MAG: APC family permease [Chloroflexi bacterium]|nr:APC family permease [Chloroflexota bacterium]